jgi:hypothetical protein
MQGRHQATTTRMRFPTTGRCQTLPSGTKDMPLFNMHERPLAQPKHLLLGLLRRVLFLRVLQPYGLPQHPNLEPAWMSKKRSGGLLHILTWLH